MNTSSLAGLLVVIAGILVIGVLAPNWQKYRHSATVSKAASRQVKARVQDMRADAERGARRRPATLAQLAALAFSLRVERSIFGLLTLVGAAGTVLTLVYLAAWWWALALSVPGSVLCGWRFKLATTRLSDTMQQIAIQRARLVSSRLPKPSAPVRVEPAVSEPVPDRSWTPVPLPAPRQHNGTLESPVLAEVAPLKASAVDGEIVTNIDEILQRRRNAG